jgi:aldose 1-epimerase
MLLRSIKTRVVGLAAVAGLLTSLSAPAVEAAPRPDITKDLFGTLSDGTQVWRYTLTSGVLRVRIITYGGIVQRLDAPDRHGRQANIVLGFPDLAGYVEKNNHQGLDRHARQDLRRGLATARLHQPGRRDGVPRHAQDVRDVQPQW